MSIKKIIKNLNRIVAGFIAAIMCLTVFPNININADDENGEIFNYLGYSVEYKVVNEWEGNRNIKIKFTNTGSKPIYNWALKFDAGGEITGLWNGAVYYSIGTEYIIKNSGYNYEILPGESVEFGYTLEGSYLTAPSGFEVCADRIEITESFDVKLVISDKWDGGFIGYIDIANNSEEPFEAWEMAFDANFEVNDFWNAKLDKIDGFYIASSKITSNPIQPHTSVQVGISASVESGEEPAILDFVMSIVKIKNYFINGGDVNGDISDDSDENVGRIFYKDLSSKEDLIYDSEGNCYVKNQILLTARSGISFETVSNLANQMYGKIVGYIELTNDYQIELNYDMSAEELLRYINDISNDPIIEYASPNIVFEAECDNFPNDTQIQPQSDVKIDKRNWSLYAINAPGAWDKYEKCKQTYPVKMGLIDNMFYEGNKDLNFVKLWNNPQSPGVPHGTRVAGIIGAEFNNNIGTAGICPKSQLYGFSFRGDGIEEIEDFGNTMKIKYALALLLGNGVKVINVSMGFTGKLEKGTKIIRLFLEKLLDLGYDFVIVNSAGNNGEDSEKYNAQKNSYFTNIPSDSPVYDRIIVVGSVVHKTDDDNVPKKDKNGNYSLECEFKKESNYGSRVDIVAPGDDVYSTTGVIHNTSAAAPQVAGVAGLLYSIDPGLSGSEVKEIIISSANESAKKNPKRKIKCDKGDGFEYPLLDAKAAVVKVLKKNGTYDPSDEDENEEAIVYGTVTDQNDKTVSGAKIKITSSDGESYSKEETADEKGEYTFTLPFGTYDIKFYVDEEPALKNLYCGKWFTIKDKKIEKDGDGFIQAYPLNVMLKDTEETSVGVFDLNEKELSEISLSVKKDGSSEEYSAVINSNGFVYGEPEDGSYTIVISKAGYTSRTITAEAKDGKLYAENGELLEKILLNPVSITVKGKVSEHNKTTNITKPLVGYTVTAVSKDNPGYAAKGTTNALGEYEISLGNAGDYTVIFTDKLQYDFYADNGEYFFDAVIEVEDDDDGSGGDKGDSGNGGNTGGGDNTDGDNDDSGNEIGEINIDLDGTDNTAYTGDQSGDLSDGIWLTVSNGKNTYYVRVYTTAESGEYRSTFGSPGLGFYTSTYHHWVHELRMSTYAIDGKLTNDIRLGYFYNKSYICFEDSMSLWKIDSINYITITGNGIIYNVHTDGYYKGFGNSIGSLGVSEENWETDVPNTMTFDYDCKCIGASSQKPF